MSIVRVTQQVNCACWLQRARAVGVKYNIQGKLAMDGSVVEGWDN